MLIGGLNCGNGRSSRECLTRSDSFTCWPITSSSALSMRRGDLPPFNENPLGSVLTLRFYLRSFGNC